MSRSRLRRRRRARTCRTRRCRRRCRRSRCSSPVIRLSTISIAATTKSVARMTSLAITGRSGRSLSSTNATSASTRGCSSRVRGTGSASPTAMSAKSTPKSGRVDAEHLFWTDRGRQPDLATDPAGAGLGELDHPLLHGVGVVDRAVRQQVDDRVARDTARRRRRSVAAPIARRVMHRCHSGRSIDLGRIGSVSG